MTTNDLLVFFLSHGPSFVFGSLIGLYFLKGRTESSALRAERTQLETAIAENIAATEGMRQAMAKLPKDPYRDDPREKALTQMQIERDAARAERDKALDILKRSQTWMVRVSVISFLALAFASLVSLWILP